MAYHNDRTNFIHYLHYDGHQYHVGERNPRHITDYEDNIRVPTVTAPGSPGNPTWQTDPETIDTGKTLFQYIQNLGCRPIRIRFPYELYCPGDCIIRSPTDPEILKDPIEWLLDKDVIIFLNGKVNGLMLSDNARREIGIISVTPGTKSKHYIDKEKEHDELHIVESEKGVGFNELKGCLTALQNEEVIKGIILKQSEIVGIISGKEEFKEEEAEINNKPEKI